MLFRQTLTGAVAGQFDHGSCVMGMYEMDQRMKMSDLKWFGAKTGPTERNGGDLTYPTRVFPRGGRWDRLPDTSAPATFTGFLSGIDIAIDIFRLVDTAAKFGDLDPSITEAFSNYSAFQSGLPDTAATKLGLQSVLDNVDSDLHTLLDVSQILSAFHTQTLRAWLLINRVLTCAFQPACT